MARLNLEDTLFGKAWYKALERLIGQEEAAGAWVLVARIAQEFWKDGRPIPKEDFMLLRFHRALLDSRTCLEMDDGIYLRGSRDHFHWLRALSTGSSEAGKKSVEGRARDEKGRLLPKVSPTVAQPLPNHDPTPSNALTLPHTLSEEHVSKSKISNIAQTPSRVERVCKFDLEPLYKKYPRKQGKKAGMRIASRAVRTELDFERLSTAIDRFIEHHRQAKTAPEYVPYFSTFMSQWEDWLDPDAGKNESFELRPDDPSLNIENILARKLGAA